MKIRTQLGLSLSGMLMVSFLVAVLAVASILKRMVQQQLDEQQASQVQMLRSVAEQAMVLGDELFLLNYVRSLKENPEIAYAYLVDKSAKILVHTQPEFVYQSLDKWKAAGRLDAVLERESAVRLPAGQAGTVRVGFSKEYAQKTLYQAWRSVLYPILGIAVAGMIVSLLLGVALAVFMSRSIQRLAKASQEIGQGNLQARVTVDTSSELGELARQFNYMAGQLQKLDELKADFISNVSHDLRSPMGAIIAYANYLLSGEIGALDPKHAKAIEIMRDQCQHLTNMVNNILDMGKLQSGAMTFAQEVFRVAETAEQVRKLFEITANYQGLSLTSAVPANLPPVSGDSEKVQQILTNLVSNALKFTRKEGRVTIGARAASDGMVQIFVEDTGTGIPPEELSRMFERFHQVDLEDQRARKIKGTGLGLAISKGFVEGMGGKIWVESQVGKGTTFHFTLPKAAEKTRAGGSL